MNTLKLFCSLLLLSPAALAGGALAIDGGQAVLWDSSFAIPYRIDLGPLSGGISHAIGVAMVEESFDQWESVATSELTFDNEGSLPINVNEASEYIPFDSGQEATNAVIFDEGGIIIQQLLGLGQHSNILGWAAPFQDASGTELVGFVSLMNGFLAVSRDDFQSTVVHEFGHSIGLDHTQINSEFVGNGINADDVNIPTMYPTDSDDNTVMSLLNPDDLAWVSKFYQSSSFALSYGEITGTLVRADGSVVQGANVLAIRQDDPLLEVYSCVSDFLADGTGTFEIPVSPGEYRLRIEPINPQFTGGSSVGPFAENGGDLSFQQPVATKVFTDNIDVDAGDTVDVGSLAAD